MSQSTQCNDCANYFGIFRCRAFPNRDIPDEIFTGVHDHRQPYPGDHGIGFEPLPENLETGEPDLP